MIAPARDPWWKRAGAIHVTVSTATAVVTGAVADVLVFGFDPRSGPPPRLSIEIGPRAPLFPNVVLGDRATSWPVRSRHEPKRVVARRLDSAPARVPTARASWRGARRPRRRRLDGRGAAA